MTVANLITLLRLLSVPFFLASLLYGNFKAALFIFLFGGVTDSLDGFIARFFNQKSVLGAVLDPLADKILLSTAFILLTIERPSEVYVIPLWVTILVLSRDIVIIMFVIIQFLFFDADIKNFLPSIYGKCTTTFQISFIIAVLIKNTYGIEKWIVDSFLILVVVFTLISGFHYLWRNRNIEVN